MRWNRTGRRAAAATRLTTAVATAWRAEGESPVLVRASEARVDDTSTSRLSFCACGSIPLGAWLQSSLGMQGVALGGDHWAARPLFGDLANYRELHVLAGEADDDAPDLERKQPQPKYAKPAECEDAQ